MGSDSDAEVMSQACAALDEVLVDNWLRHVQDVRSKHQSELDTLETEAERHNRLCELNVIEQVVNVSKTTVVT